MAPEDEQNQCIKLSSIYSDAFDRKLFMYS
jgi:hypothetical protein